MQAVREMLKASMSPILSIIFTQEEDGNFLQRTLNDQPPSPSTDIQLSIFSHLTLSVRLIRSKSHFYCLLIQH